MATNQGTRRRSHPALELDFRKRSAEENSGRVDDKFVSSAKLIHKTSDPIVRTCKKSTINSSRRLRATPIPTQPKRRRHRGRTQYVISTTSIAQQNRERNRSEPSVGEVHKRSFTESATPLHPCRRHLFHTCFYRQVSRQALLNSDQDTTRHSTCRRRLTTLRVTVQDKRSRRHELADLRSVTGFCRRRRCRRRWNKPHAQEQVRPVSSTTRMLSLPPSIFSPNFFTDPPPLETHRWQGGECALPVKAHRCREGRSG